MVVYHHFLERIYQNVGSPFPNYDVVERTDRSHKIDVVLVVVGDLQVANISGSVPKDVFMVKIENCVTVGIERLHDLKKSHWSVRRNSFMSFSSTALFANVDLKVN